MRQAVARDLAIRLAGQRVVSAHVNFQRRRLVFAHAAVELFDLPGPQSLLELFGELVRVGGGLERLGRYQPGGLMVAVPVAWLAVTPRDDHIGAVNSHRVDNVAERDVLPQCSSVSSNRFENPKSVTRVNIWSTP